MERAETRRGRNIASMCGDGKWENLRNLFRSPQQTVPTAVLPLPSNGDFISPNDWPERRLEVITRIYIRRIQIKKPDTPQFQYSNFIFIMHNYNQLVPPNCYKINITRSILCNIMNDSTCPKSKCTNPEDLL